ncbi:MAG TPA: PilZ domain-containing protein [Syntrophorhabdaceae bacterium]|nr:PilZ domain-containing protein [Syntrophorhabdaceae bacterium]HPP05773.1 PilZ domain-containing protein [Syntrophorhabdaceae bacterium]
MEHRERREFFRIDDRLTLKFRIIDEEEFRYLEDIIRFSPASSFLDTHELSFLKKIELNEEKNKDPVYTYLKIIDRKLDLILDMLAERSQEDSPYNTIQTEVNLSASGVRFSSEIPVKKDDLMELIIILPVYPHMRISALCRVVRTKINAKNGYKIYEVSLQFVVINEGNRDVLIRYILAKEREMLRIKKDTAG